MSMKVSERGLELIKQFEGCVLTAYRDSIGVLTIGYGHTGMVREGMTISRERAEELLREDIAHVERCLSNSLQTAVTQSEFDALASFTFNLGCGRLRGSTLLRLVNSGDPDGLAAAEFEKWVYARHEKLDGLVKRRKAEAELFRSTREEC